MASGAPVPQALDLFLIGKTGHGKSSTGNTILGREEFKDSDSSESATLDTAVGWTNINGTIVKVVDGPGLVDTRTDKEGRRIQAEKKLSSGFIHCPKGFHALLLVLKYGGRFTDEEVQTIDILRAMFGPSFIKHHCVLIFTHGENFEAKAKRQQGKTFEGWLKEQKGGLAALLEECEHRAVLFYNMTDDKRGETLKKLYSCVKKIEKRYTNDMFGELKRERSRFIVCSGAIQLKEHIQADLSLLNAMLNPKAGKPNKQVLGPLLERLEKSLSQEDEHSETVKNLMIGVKQAKEGEYDAAYATFRRIEAEGAHSLRVLWEISIAIVSRMLLNFFAGLFH